MSLPSSHWLYSGCFFIAKLRAIQGPQCQPCLFTAVAHVKQHQQQAIVVTGKRHVLSYNRAQLLSVTAARLTPDLVCRLRQLGIGYDLPRKRTRRGGRRKQRRIPTAVTAHRVPVPLSADHNLDVLVCDDAGPWTVDMCLSHSKPTRHADLSNLTSATLTKPRSFFFFFFLAFAVYTIKAAREMNDVVFSSSCLQP